MVKAHEDIKVREDQPTIRFTLTDVSKRRGDVDLPLQWEESLVNQLLISRRIQKYNRLAMVVLHGVYEATNTLTLLEVILLLVFVVLLANALIPSKPDHKDKAISSDIKSLSRNRLLRMTIIGT